MNVLTSPPTSPFVRFGIAVSGTAALQYVLGLLRLSLSVSICYEAEHVDGVA